MEYIFYTKHITSLVKNMCGLNFAFDFCQCLLQHFSQLRHSRQEIFFIGLFPLFYYCFTCSYIFYISGYSHHVNKENIRNFKLQRNIKATVTSSDEQLSYYLLLSALLKLYCSEGRHKIAGQRIRWIRRDNSPSGMKKCQLNATHGSPMNEEKSLTPPDRRL